MGDNIFNSGMREKIKLEPLPGHKKTVKSWEKLRVFPRFSTSLKMYGLRLDLVFFNFYTTLTIMLCPKIISN